MSKPVNKNYLTGKEIRAITKENAKVMKRLEAYKNRKCDEKEYLTEMHDDSNILEIDGLHTYFFTDQGTVKAVNGVSYDVPKNSVVGIVGESGCGKSVTSMSVMRLIQGPPVRLWRAPSVSRPMTMSGTRRVCPSSVPTAPSVWRRRSTILPKCPSGRSTGSVASRSP